MKVEGFGFVCYFGINTMFANVRRISIALALLAVFGSACACAQSITPVNGLELTRSQDMKAARASHTATLLNDGRVLITGGFVAEGNTLKAAELFDPASSKFSAAENMSERRLSHTATLLPNGKVLIAGGFNGDYLNSAEIFDPATNKFTPVGKLIEPRSDHVAVLLKNGKVLLAGGVGTGWTFLKSAEVFDPQTGSFSRTGDLSISRESHAAALLSDGTVLIAGGHSGRRNEMRVFSQAEIFDSASGTFSPVGGMTTKRHKHAAVTLDDGRVLIVGGSDELDARGAYKSAEIYDPRLRRFAAIENMTQSRYKLRATVVRLSNGKVLIAGGAKGAEVFDPKSSSFYSVLGDTDDVKLFATATTLRDGRVLIAGGYNNRIAVSPAAWIVKL